MHLVVDDKYIVGTVEEYRLVQVGSAIATGVAVGTGTGVDVGTNTKMDVGGAVEVIRAARIN